MFFWCDFTKYRVCCFYTMSVNVNRCLLVYNINRQRKRRSFLHFIVLSLFMFGLFEYQQKGKIISSCRFFSRGTIIQQCFVYSCTSRKKTHELCQTFHHRSTEGAVLIGKRSVKLLLRSVLCVALQFSGRIFTHVTDACVYSIN